MRYSIIAGRELTPDLTARWAEIQQADPALASPYFHPEFTRAVAGVRDDLFVALLENGGRVAGFFPFHRRQGGVAKPVGLGLSDYHGVIAEPDVEWSAEDLLRACKLVRWDFDHLPVGQRHFAAYHAGVSDSPIIDVSQGMAAFEASRDRAGRKQLREVRRRGGKLAEQVGPLTFTLHSTKEEILRQLLAWKTEQCLRTGTIDFFALAWCVELVERIWAAEKPDFGGILSTLYAGDTLAALHFTIYSRRVWHSWFPAYNHNLEEYSPGFILLLELIRAASDRGIGYIDLGKGISLYKKRVMTGSIPVAEGSLAIPSIRNRVRQLRIGAEEWGRQSFLRPLLRIPGRIIRKMEQKSRYG